MLILSLNTRTDHTSLVAQSLVELSSGHVITLLLLLFFRSPGRGVDSQADDEEEQPVEHAEDGCPAVTGLLLGS